MSDVAAAYAALNEAAPAYEEARKYHDGDIGEVFSSRRLRRLLSKQGDSYKVNLARIPADAVADRLEVVSVTVAGAGDDDLGAQRLAEIAEANQLEFVWSQLHHQACALGDGYLLVWEDPEDENGVVINYHSPTQMRLLYDAENPRKKRLAVHAWTVKGADGQERTRANLWYADRVERWVTAPGSKPTDAQAWQEHLTDENDPDSWKDEHPYGEVPVFHFRTGLGTYGTPLAKQGWGAQDAVNKIVITHMSTIDFQGAPQRYALTEAGEVDDDFDVDEDPDFDVDGTGTDPARPDDAKGLETGPGELWWLKNVKSVGQFDPADADTFLKPLKAYTRIMAQTTDTPLDIMDDSGDPLTGEARRRKDGPFVKKVNSIAKRFAAEAGAALSLALKIAGMDGRQVVVKYAPAEIVSDAEGWATVKAKIEAGVPVRDALLETGYPVEKVDEWFPEGEENSLRVADLEAVAAILKDLGTAVALNIITAEEARALMPEGVLPDLAAPPADTGA